MMTSKVSAATAPTGGIIAAQRADCAIPTQRPVITPLPFAREASRREPHDGTIQQIGERSANIDPLSLPGARQAASNLSLPATPQLPTFAYRQPRIVAPGRRRDTT